MFDHPTLCDPDRCEVKRQCPYDDPAENCQLEIEFMAIAKEWAEKLPESPVTKLRVEVLLYPLFLQYFRLRLAQEASGKPIKDIRNLIRALDLVLNSIKQNN